MNQRPLFHPHNVTDKILNSKLLDAKVQNAKHLVSSKRIDLVAKLQYIESQVTRKNLSFSDRLYCAHIEAFSNGQFVEPGQEDSKNGIDSFREVFNKLILNISAFGFDSTKSRIPVGRDGVIIDGSHRVSVCAYFDLPIEITQFDIMENIYNYEYFKERLLEEKYLDFIIQKYIQLNNRGGVFTLCIWPKAFKYRNKIIDRVKDSFILVYEKAIKLNMNGGHSFITQIYSHDSWVGHPDNKFSGSFTKSNECFNDEDPLVLLVIETTKTLNEIVGIKESIRDELGLGKHSIHITDNHNETKQIGELLLNENSIDHLNFGRPFQLKLSVIRLLNLKAELMARKFELSEVIIDGSGPMEAFGLREANDIDIISECELTAGRYFDVRSLNELQKLYGNRVDELNSPENYFYFFGLKFVSLNKIVEGKKHRGENKDLSDVKLINEFLRSNNISALSVFKERYRRKKMILWRDIKRNLKNTKRNLKNALNKMGLLNIVKKLIRK